MTTKKDRDPKENIRKSRSRHNHKKLSDTRLFNYEIGMKQDDDENYIRTHGQSMTNPRDTIMMNFLDL